jgi:hypothetical protein
VHLYGEISIAILPKTWFESRWRMIASRGVRLMVTCEVIRSLLSASICKHLTPSTALMNSPTTHNTIAAHSWISLSPWRLNTQAKGSQKTSPIMSLGSVHQPTNQTQHVATPNTIQPTPNVTASAPLSLLPNAQALPLCVN